MTEGPATPRIGTAGWSIPRTCAPAFSAEGTGLWRYAARFAAVEINTTFYRSPRPQTLARWAQTTPPGFRFSVKAPRALTHEAKLVDCEPRLARFLAELEPLGRKLGPILLQLPPSLAFSRPTAERFFGFLRAQWAGPVACEPRHASWFEDAAELCLQSFRIARVAADPVRAPGADRPGGDPGLAYWRLHGAPRPYYSSYPPEALDHLAAALAQRAPESTWCIFDNTASGAAVANALALCEVLRARAADPD
ncbi:DUF72 domain-containing protein [Phenylobacterium sp.]|jgi:uncharacterized protein YecE (DUF72 family)|uniref:DUF72 domain-containing protein n=1 Tax=Phenylobacterium sp. TaxID=1871053 RepID=UPI002F40EDBF